MIECNRFIYLLLLQIRFHEIQSGTTLEVADLFSIVGVREYDVRGTAVCLAYTQLQKEKRSKRSGNSTKYEIDPEKKVADQILPSEACLVRKK